MSAVAMPIIVWRTNRSFINQLKESEVVSIHEIQFFHLHYHSNSKSWEQSHCNILELGGQLTFTFKRIYSFNLKAWDSIVSQHIRVWEVSNIQEKSMKYKTPPQQSEIQRGLMGNTLLYGSEGGHCLVENFVGRNKTKLHWNFKTWILSPG